MKGPCWIKQWIADFAMLNEQFRNEDGTVDFAALGREEYLFRTALITCNFSKSSRAKDVYEIAKRAYDSLSEKGKKGGRPRKEEPGAEAIDSSKGKKSAQAGSHKAGNAIAPIPAAAPAEPVVMNLAYSGEFGNVRLTQEEYSELGIRFANKRALDRAIDSLSCQIENGEKNPKSHYAELVKWATYRDDKAEERKADQEEKAVAKNTMSFQEIEGQRQVEQLRKYGLIK